MYLTPVLDGMEWNNTPPSTSSFLVENNIFMHMRTRHSDLSPGAAQLRARQGARCHTWSSNLPGRLVDPAH